MKKGFTLIELLVASLLLGMLVTILTMVFNQSSIAWRTGKASVAEMDVVRRQLSQCQKQADDMLVHVSAAHPQKVCRVVSPWDANSKGNEVRSDIRSRSVFIFRKDSSGNGQADTKKLVDSFGVGQRPAAWQRVEIAKGKKGDQPGGYVVGVTSWGPDGIKDTNDDISSWPEGME